jgi:hypothetical protein
LLRKVITYENAFTKEKVSEEHYFHISKADMIDMEMAEHGVTYEKDGQTFRGMQAYLQRISDSEDAPEALRWIKEIFRRAYVKRVGDRPVKSPEIWKEFEESEAYSELVFELISDPEKLAEFINAVFPGDLDKLAEEIKERAKQYQAENVAEPSEPSDPTGLTEEVTPRVLTTAEMSEMDADELQSGLATGRYKLS